MMAIWARLPLVIHILEPLMIQSEPSRRAWVRIEDGSEPESGSVRPKHPITSPEAIRGSHSCFCSSEPNFQIGNIASDPCTDTNADPRVARLQFEAGEAVGGAGGPGTAVSLQVHPQQAHVPHRLGHLDREDALFPPLAHVGDDLLADEVAHCVTQQALLLVEEGVGVEEVAGVRRLKGDVAHGTANAISRREEGDEEPLCGPEMTLEASIPAHRKACGVTRPGSSR
jgi:hypothetical protein